MSLDFISVLWQDHLVENPECNSVPYLVCFLDLEVDFVSYVLWLYP